MRTLLSIASSILLIPAYTKAQQSPSEGISCFENLAAPEYPKAALQAHVDGSVWTTTQVSPQGSIEKIDNQVVSAWSEGSRMLTPAVEKVLRAAKIKPQCAGKTISVVFRYQLHGEATAAPEGTSRTEAPNTMYIESQPAARTETLSAGKSPATQQRLGWIYPEAPGEVISGAAMDFYAALDIPMDADREAIRSAYRILARRYHPDTGIDSSAEKFRQITEAYETLGDPGRRHEYALSRSGVSRPAMPEVEPITAHPESFYQENPAVFGRVGRSCYRSPFRPSYGFDDWFERIFDDLFSELQWPWPR